MENAEPIGCSEAHKGLLQVLSRVAPTDAEILITGPSGVGKELYARYAHHHSRRSRSAFVPVNCGTLPYDLFENEMFGHIGGAFTGARPRSEGLIQCAEGGTLFLDEIDGLPHPCQVKLLRFLQEKEYRRLGESHLRRANVRIIAATNCDLLQALSDKRFREDLFFRLRVVPVYVPPLAQRQDDIASLLQAFVQRYAEQYSFAPVRFSAEALARIHHYDWPGNIRELENCIRHLTCLQLSRPVQVTDLPLLDHFGRQPAPVDGPRRDWTRQPLQEAKRELVNDFERSYLENALRQSGGNIARAAQASGKARRAFFELMRKHNIQAEHFRATELLPRTA